VIDKRGRVSAGKDDMGGVPAGLIGTVVTDNGTIVGTTLGSKGGSATHALIVGEIPPHSHTATVTDPGHPHDVKYNHPVLYTGGGGSGAVDSIAAGGSSTGSAAAVSNTTGISVSNASIGGGAAHALLQPTAIVNYILRVL